MFKGWKTLAFGLFMVVVPPALDFLGAVNWQSMGISPGVSAAIGAVVIALRAFTSTPIGRKAALGALAAGAISLSACAGLDRAQLDEKLNSACQAAMVLAPVSGNLRPWIEGGCGTAQSIAKLAEDPGSLAWVMDLIDKARALR